MKKITFFLFILLAGNKIMAQYKPVDQGSTLKFKIQNLGFDVNGTFSGFQGTIHFDSQNPAKASFDVTIDAKTVNTDNSLRDSHLKDAGYFDIKNYPAIRFVSDKVLPGNKAATFMVNGKLTIKGKSQDVSFPFTAAQANDGYLFKGSFKIKRRDFDIGGTSTISNELEVFLTVLAKKDLVGI